MIAGRLQETARILGGTLSGEDAAWQGVSTDSRTLMEGAIFFALKGPRFDGHDSLPEAAGRGARAAVVSRETASSIPLIRVEDPRRALGMLATDWRLRHVCPVIGITGSNGKTTTKEMTAGILRLRGPTLATEGNLNNDIGVPMTLFRLDHAHVAAVIEMGANRMADIADLAAIARPTIGVVTMCGPAHLEGFGSLENVAIAKGRMFEALDKAGTAIINRDDPFYLQWRQSSRAGHLLTFGLTPQADFHARHIELDGNGERLTFELHSPAGTAAITLQLQGRHNVRNALAAAAAAMSAGATLAEIVAGLGSLVAVKGRLQRRPGRHGAVLIDDTYNANPSSLHAALEVLAAAPGRRWLVLGDMGELGADELILHRDAGRAAREAGIERLYAVGERAREAAAAFGSGAQHFTDRATLATALREILAPDITVLIKGSRFMQMDEVLQALLAEELVSC